MKPEAFTHRESGENLLLGVELLTAWAHSDRAAFNRLSLRVDPSETRSALVAICRAATSALRYLATDQQQLDQALEYVRAYALMRRDELGGDEQINESNRKG